jgi:hypothetical protein
MAMDGTYGFVYCGANGIGLGVLTVTKGVVRGSDYAGGKYDGTAQENADGTIDLTLSFEVRPGVALVQGTSAQDVPHTRQINAHLPPHFGDGEPQEIASPPGTVTVMFKRVSDEFAPAATEGFTVTTARRLAAPES